MVEMSFTNILFSILGALYVAVTRYIGGQSQWLVSNGNAVISQSNSIVPPMLTHSPAGGLGRGGGDMLGRSMESLANLLTYFDTRINEDPLIDVFATCNMMAGTMGQLNSSRIEDVRLRDKLKHLIETAESIVHRGGLLLQLSDPEYYKKLGLTMEANLWVFGTERRTLPNVTYNESAFISLDQFLEGHTDQCISEILHCEVSDACWGYMTDPYQSGYMPTHQMLYLLIAYRKCRKETDDVMRRHNRTSIGQIYDSLCGNVYDEFKHMEVKGYPELYRDLYCEQLLVCGMVGYHQFFSRPSLEAIMSWQSKDGCYRYKSIKTMTDLSNVRTRVKRNELIKKDMCFPHYTVVCGGALANYIRYLIDDPTLGQH